MSRAVSACDRGRAASQILALGVGMMLSLLPGVRHAVLPFEGKARLVLVAILAAEAILSLVLLFRRIRCRRLHLEEKLASTLANAIRARIC